MLEFIKYTRFKIREHQGFCMPKGPNFKSAKKYKYCLQGSDVSFNAPTQYHFFRPGSEQFTSSWKIDNLEDMSVHNLNTYGNSWSSSKIFIRKYALYGPWFTGEQARATFSVTAISPEDEQFNVNFLNPKAFETALAGYLTANYGYLISEDGSPDYLAPINWEPVAGFPVPTARFRVESECWNDRISILSFPVSSSRILIFRFSFQQSSAGSFEEVDAIISPKPAQELIENIINSVEITPSEELKKELDEIRKTCPDLSVSEEFPPLKWPAKVDDSGLHIVELNTKELEELAR